MSFKDKYTNPEENEKDKIVLPIDVYALIEVIEAELQKLNNSLRRWQK